MLAANATQGLTDCRMLGIKGMAGNTTGTGNSGYSTAQCRHRIAFAGSRQVSPHHLRCGGHGDETVPVAPALVVR